MTPTAREILQKALIALLATPLIAGVFLAAIIGAFAIPNEKIVAHLMERPEVLTARRADNGRVIDADTECIGLSIGLDIGADASAPLLERAVNAQSLFGCEPLIRWAAGSRGEAVRDYFRYWHGYLAIARPALAVAPYNDLRGLLFTLSVGLFIWLLWRIGGDFGAAAALAVAAPFVVLNAMGLFVVVTKATTWFLAIGAAVALSRRTSAALPLLFFFGLGALVAYFDFFTAPAFVFCFAGMIWALYEERAGRSPTWPTLLILGAFSAAGWMGLILAKIVIAAAVLDGDVWRVFFEAALYRVNGETTDVDNFTPGMALAKNFAAMKSIWAPIALVAFVILPFATKARRDRWARLIKARSVLLGLAAAPLVFMEIFSNHTQIHAAFTQINFAPAFVLASLVVSGRAIAGRGA